MGAAFELAMAQTLGFEGELSDVEGDRGGLTFRGITQGLYDRWRRKHGLPLRSVTLCTSLERAAISREEFWDPCRCDELPAALAIAVFDMAFHSSPHDAKIALQQALGFRGDAVDGLIGKNTMAAVRAAPMPLTVLRFLKARGAEMQQIIKRDSTQVKFLEGWIARLLDQAWKGGKP